MKTDKKINTRRIIPTVICALLAAVLIFALVFGVIAAVRELNSVAGYGGVTVDRGVASYLVATYKADHIARLISSGVAAVDTPVFWDSIPEGYTDTTYGDLLKRETEKYIRSVVVCAYLYDRYATLGASDRELIGTNVSEVLDYRAENSVEKFNELSAPMGFDYADFKAATELIYKAERAKDAIYGVGGAGLAYAANIKECDKYFDTYSHVKIIYIRTNDKYELDEHGNRITEDGRDKTVTLTDEERTERWEDIAAIKASIEAIKNGTNGQMSREYFDSFYFNEDGSYRYNDDPDNALSGYYFSESSAYTAEFAEFYPEAVDAALNMKEGDYDVVGRYDEDGILEAVLVISKCERDERAYASSQLSHFFTDFYSDAAIYLFTEKLDQLVGEVNFKDAFYEIDPTLVPKNLYLTVG